MNLKGLIVSAKIISIVQGDTYSAKVSVTGGDGDPFDLSGFNMTFTAKHDLSLPDAEADINSTATIETPSSNGVGRIKLKPSDTDIPVSDGYRYDIQISDGGDNVHTIVKNGKLLITPQVTKDK